MKHPFCCTALSGHTRKRTLQNGAADPDQSEEKVPSSRSFQGARPDPQDFSRCELDCDVLWLRRAGNCSLSVLRPQEFVLRGKAEAAQIGRVMDAIILGWTAECLLSANSRNGSVGMSA